MCCNVIPIPCVEVTVIEGGVLELIVEVNPQSDTSIQPRQLRWCTCAFYLPPCN